MQPDRLIEPDPPKPSRRPVKPPIPVAEQVARDREREAEGQYEYIPSPKVVERQAQEARDEIAFKRNRLKKLNQDQREKLRASTQNEFTDAVIAGLIENIRTMQELANGIWVEETTKEGTRRVYREKPDRQALMFLVEHGIGKATAREKKPVAPMIQLVHRVPRPPGTPKARIFIPAEDEDEPIENDDAEPDDSDE